MRFVKLFLFLTLVAAIGVNIDLPIIASSILGNLGRVYTVHEVFTSSYELNDKRNQANIAIRFYNAALDLDPEEENLISWSGMTAMVIQDWNQAGLRYSDYLARGGSSQEVLNSMRGLLITNKWCTTKEDPIFQLATQIGSKALSYKLIGDVCSTLGRKEQAIIAYRRSLNYSPDDIVTISLAYDLFSLTNDIKAVQPEKAQIYWAEVVRLLAKFIDTEFPDSQVYYTLAWSNWQLNKFDEALEAYKRCIDLEIKTDYRSICAFHLGYAYSDWLPISKQDLVKSLEYFKLAEELRPSLVQPSEIQIGLGRALARMKKYDQAIPHFQNAIRFDPGCLTCRHQLAETYMLVGLNQKAIQQYEAILREAPNDERASSTLLSLRGK